MEPGRSTMSPVSLLWTGSLLKKHNNCTRGGAELRTRKRRGGAELQTRRRGGVRSEGYKRSSEKDSSRKRVQTQFNTSFSNALLTARTSHGPVPTVLQGEVLSTRRTWGSSIKILYSGCAQSRMCLPSQSFGFMSNSVLCPSLEKEQRTRTGTSLERRDAYCSIRSAGSDVASSKSQTLLLLISDTLPAYEMVLSGVKAGVVTVLYDHRHSLCALVAQMEKALSGQRVLRLGVLAPGGTEAVHLLQTSGVSLMQSLSALTGLELHAPMGFATGTFQNILGQWCDSSLQQSPCPALHYIHDCVLEAWCTQAHWAELCLCKLRTSVGKELQWFSVHSRGRAIGYYFQEKICPKSLCMSTALNKALTEGLAALASLEETKQLEFLASFLTKHVGVKTSSREAPGAEVTIEGSNDGTFCVPHSSVTVEPHLSVAVLDWRRLMVQELYHSECLYLSRLAAVHKVYQEPLTAALNSNTAIISIMDISVILSPVSQILELNRVLQTDLDSRVRQWSAQQCVGDVFVKFCLKLRVYTNYFNNYCTALQIIDKCREMKPLFRLFLKRTDRTLATHMLSLQELLLCPLWRIKEYCTLLQALSLHTAPEHADHTYLSSALSTLRRYKDFLHELKQNSQREKVMEETQQMIHSCPNLIEGNRQLITTHKCALYRSLDEQLPDSVRALKLVADMGLFLFTDALVLTRLSLHHIPFSVAQSCSHTFVASVALSSLAVREINHSRYVSHAFVLEGPSRSWVCALDSALEREVFLSVLRTAIETALTGHQ